MSRKKSSTYYIDHRGAGAKLGALLFDFLSSCDSPFRELVFICIGSDRITGDSLGPLVGHSLSRQGLTFAYVYGTLSQPVHALNLRETIDEIKLRHPDSLLIAIDASLGARKHTGYLTISKGSLEPGLGVRKKLPPVGDISITGIVNAAGNFDHFTLQTTKLSTVVRMADAIVFGILIAYRRYFCGARQTAPLASFPWAASQGDTQPYPLDDPACQWPRFGFR